MIGEGTFRSSSTVEVRDGEEQISEIKGSGSFGDRAFELEVLIVKGEVEHEVDDFTCDRSGVVGRAA